ncbi:hypothetical protein TNCV_2660101 [Trichonephila clavipes]|uniref:Uncharacterized protein n=1 Tax=Trichonephila clavipes TaxID=2585209 RepID=A0A8X6RAL1_TRICX|nr:hypothetical protein TNCV_2660101 [Trichonephila clavipes]
MLEFKAPNHLMILIPAKMNFQDYDDIVDMFNVPTMSVCQCPFCNHGCMSSLDCSARRLVSTLHTCRRFTSLHDGTNRCLLRAHFNDRTSRDAARETRRIGICRSTPVDTVKRAIKEAKHVNEFRPDDFLWEKFCKGLLRNPDRPLKNTDKRMVYIYSNMFFVKKDFTFGFRTVTSGEIHIIQTTNVPMLIYEFQSSSLRCRANMFGRSFEPYDQMLYLRMVLGPHTA